MIIVIAKQFMGIPICLLYDMVHGGRKMELLLNSAVVIIFFGIAFLPFLIVIIIAVKIFSKMNTVIDILEKIYKKQRH